MKTNEAPERIHIQPNAHDGWFESNPQSDIFIEYIRTDAFIKKACDAYCNVCGHYHHTVPYEICRHDCNYYDDFKELLKGE